MKTRAERARQRMRTDRAMTTISIRMPEDVVDELKEFAPLLGFSGYQPLIRAYISEGLRRDEAALERSGAEGLANSLRRHGVADDVISKVVAETMQRPA